MKDSFNIQGNLDDATLRGIDRDLDRIMHATRNGNSAQLYRGLTTIDSILAVLIGQHASRPPEEQLELIMTHAVKALQRPYQREAATILLSLDGKHGNFSDRVTRVVDLYRALSDDPDTAPELRPTRTNRQVVLRTEVPEIRYRLIEAMADMERRFSSARRASPASRSTGNRPVKVMTWDVYEHCVTKLAEQILRLPVERPDVPPLDDAWAVVGIVRGGLPVATHLSHMLGCNMFGTAGVWRYRDQQGGKHTMIDGLYSPPQDPSGRPTHILLVDDVVKSGHKMAAAEQATLERYQDETKNFRPGRVEIFRASLLADPGLCPKDDDRWLWAEEFDSRTTWWRFPWEAAY